MKYLVDSDWVADWLAGRQSAIELLTTLSQDGLAISLITFGEIFEGIYFGRDPERAERGFRDFIRGVTVLPLSRPIMQRFARIRGELRRSGKIIGDPDILIAATAMHHGQTLLTRNEADFKRVPGLTMYERN